MKATIQRNEQKHKTGIENQSCLKIERENTTKPET